MDNKIKNYIGIAAIVAALLFAVGYLSYVSSYSKSMEPGSYRTFQVSGEGKVTVVPDLIKFSFSVVTEGKKDIGALQTENTGKMNAAIALLKEQGIKDEDIKTSNYSIAPRYEYYSCKAEEMMSSIRPCPPAEISGYTITQTVSVKVRDFSKIGGIISGVVEKGANSVSSLSFTVDDMVAVEKQARDLAVAQAKDKASALASAGGFRVGRLLSINEGSTPYYYGKGGGSDVMYETASAAPAPTIEAGSQEVSITLTLSYEIK
jgi:uncharacterized protein